MQTNSLYEIVNEIVEEKQGNLEEEVTALEISKKTSDYSKKFKEILSGLHINLDYFQDNTKKKPEYKIPTEAKDAVKKLLLLYTSKPMKDVRKSQFDHLTFSDMNDIVECIKVLLCCTLQGKTLLVELNKLEVLTQYSVKEAFSFMQEDSLSKLIQEATEILKPKIERSLNHPDRVEIMKYYNLEINILNKRLREIIDIVIDIRENEILATSLQQGNQEVDVKFPIHEQVLKELLKESNSKSPTEEYFKNLNELMELCGIADDATVLKELTELALHKKNSLHFKLVTNEDADFGQNYRSSEEVIYEAVKIYHGETK